MIYEMYKSYGTLILVDTIYMIYHDKMTITLSLQKQITVMFLISRTIITCTLLYLFVLACTFAWLHCASNKNNSLIIMTNCEI